MATAQRTYLEMREPSARCAPARVDDPTIRVEHAADCFRRALALSLRRGRAAVPLGGPARLDGRATSARTWTTIAVSIWLMIGQGTLGRVFRAAARTTTTAIEIAYFGLFEEFTGRGLGGASADRAVGNGLGHDVAPRLAAHLLARSSGGAAELHEARLHARSRPKSILCDVTEPLWAPSRERVARRNLTRFMREVVGAASTRGRRLRVALPLLDRSPGRLLAGGLGLRRRHRRARRARRRSISSGCRARASFPTRG